MVIESRNVFPNSLTFFWPTAETCPSWKQCQFGPFERPVAYQVTITPVLHK